MEVTLTKLLTLLFKTRKEALLLPLLRIDTVSHNKATTTTMRWNYWSDVFMWGWATGLPSYLPAYD